MKGISLLASSLLLLSFSVSAPAQEKGYWRAASSNAASITGDLQLSDTRLTINFAGFTIAPIRKLEPAEVSAIFPSEDMSGASGSLYRLNIPAARRFVRHNTLCGSEDTQWMVTSMADKALHVAFFSGTSAPVFTPEALEKSTDLCGTFTYVR